MHHRLIKPYFRTMLKKLDITEDDPETYYKLVLNNIINNQIYENAYGIYQENFKSKSKIPNMIHYIVHNLTKSELKKLNINSANIKVYEKFKLLIEKVFIDSHNEPINNILHKYFKNNIIKINNNNNNNNTKFLFTSDNSNLT